MTEHATKKDSLWSGNPIANHVVYWRVSALALIGVALLGIALNAILGTGAWIVDPGFLTFDWTHNVVHVLLAAIAVAFGFTALAEKPISRTMAAVIGVTYLGLGVVGFVPPVTEFLGSTLGLHLELGENLIHLLLGSWGAYAGFTS